MKILKGRCGQMIFTIEEIKKRVKPVADKYALRAVYVFGSYARNEADAESDVDILVDRTGSNIKGMFDMGNLYNDLCDCIGKEIDLVTTQTLAQQSTQSRIPYFAQNLHEERIQIYG